MLIVLNVLNAPFQGFILFLFLANYAVVAKSFKVMVLVPSAAAIWLITHKPRSAMGDQSIRSVNIKATILPHLYVVIKHWYYVMEGTTRDAAVKRAMTGK